MSKKNKQNRIRLVAIFVILLVAVFAIQINKNKKGERSFRAELMEFNIDDVTSLSLQTKPGDSNILYLMLKNGEWLVNVNDKSYDADSDLVKNMINELASLKAVQKVAASKDKWSNFDVTDSTGVHVKVNSDKKVIGDIFIGSFSYNQNTRKPKTYVRLNKEKDVFAVEGYLSMTFNRDLNGLRDKSIFRGNKKDFIRISVKYPADSSFILSKEENGWMINGVIADSAKVETYLGSLAYLTGSEFREDTDVSLMASAPMSITLEGNNMSSVEIKAIKFEDGSTALLSSENPKSVFNGDSQNLFNKIFIGPGNFSPGDQ